MKQRSDLVLFPADPFSDLLTGIMRPFSLGFGEATPSLKLDVCEGADAYDVKADIPGVEKSDIDVSVEGNVVSIAAHTNQAREIKEGDRVLRHERRYGAVSRQFSLAHDVDLSRAQAKYENGVLSLNLPKKASTPADRIEIQ